MSSSKNLQQILTALPSLPQEELLQVKAKVEAAPSLSSPTPSPAQSEDDWLLQGISRVLRARGLVRGDTMSHLARLYKVQDQIMAVQVSLLESVGRELNTVEKVMFGQITAQALADMISMYAPVSPRMMLQTAARNKDGMSGAREALEAAFPGYLQGGMISLLVGQREG